jgi:hypothetical protein
MAYQVGKTISVGDINSYGSTNSYNLDKLWGSGADDYGYGLKMILADGETAYANFPTVSPGDKIRKVHWAFVPSQIPVIALHQGTTLPNPPSSIRFGLKEKELDGVTPGGAPVPPGTIPTDQNVIGAYDYTNATTAINANIQELYTNRLNAAFQSPYNITSTASLSTTWSDKFVAKFTIYFGPGRAADGSIPADPTAHARYFFNNGGQIAINSGHGATIANTINNLIADLCGDAGTLIISSPTSTSPNSGVVRISGINYTGVVKVGGTGAAPRSVIADANYGFYYFYSSSYTANTTVRLHTQYSDMGYTTNPGGRRYGAGGGYSGATSNYSVDASYDKAGTMTITVTVDEVPNNLVVQGGTYTTLTLRQPANNFGVLDNWITPTITADTSLSS